MMSSIASQRSTSSSSSSSSSGGTEERTTSGARTTRSAARAAAAAENPSPSTTTTNSTNTNNNTSNSTSTLPPTVPARRQIIINVHTGTGSQNQSGRQGQNPPLASVPRRSVKRPGSLVYNGKVDSWKDGVSEYNCPICMDVLKEAVITRCGHTFCDGCIRPSLAVKPVCPQCGTGECVDHLIPNSRVNEMVAKYMSGKALKTEVSKLGNMSPLQVLNCFGVSNMNVNNIDHLIMILQKQRQAISAESKEHDRALLREFLSQLLKIKNAEQERVNKEVHLIEQDLHQINSLPLPEEEGVQNSNSNSEAESSSDEAMAISLNSPSEIEGFNTQSISRVEFSDKSLAARRRRIHSHFEELTEIYMDTRKAELHDVKGNDATVPNDGGAADYENLDEFGQTLSKISQYSALKPLATLSYSADMVSSNNIVSSIEFDKDNEYFAIAGVTKKIKLFEYVNVIGSTVDIHCPTTELQCNAKISCVSWSSYYKNRMASSDYDGCVSLWDVQAGVRTTMFNEHEKRVWSVDWSHGDPRLLASGSDDSKVKLWTTQTDRSLQTIEAKANVCCVKFCPQNSFVVAFGCADHCIHYYDFRHPKKPLAILAGHKKAVSYVKFASKDELVSASTDSHLKLWNLSNPNAECVRSFTGHTNEKNFVGLATDGHYIACGSENNSLYVYYRNLSKPLLSFKFDNYRNILDKPKSDDAGEFVSAVVWKKGSPVVVAANSQGSIKILELI